MKLLLLLLFPVFSFGQSAVEKQLKKTNDSLAKVIDVLRSDISILKKQFDILSSSDTKQTGDITYLKTHGTKVIGGEVRRGVLEDSLIIQTVNPKQDSLNRLIVFWADSIPKLDTRLSGALRGDSYRLTQMNKDITALTTYVSQIPQPYNPAPIIVEIGRLDGRIDNIKVPTKATSTTTTTATSSTTTTLE